jgi:hypothetical protein
MLIGSVFKFIFFGDPTKNTFNTKKLWSDNLRSPKKIKIILWGWMNIIIFLANFKTRVAAHAVGTQTSLSAVSMYNMTLRPCLYVPRAEIAFCSWYVSCNDLCWVERFHLAVWRGGASVPVEAESVLWLQGDREREMRKNHLYCLISTA